MHSFPECKAIITKLGEDMDAYHEAHGPDSFHDWLGEELHMDVEAVKKLEDINFTAISLAVQLVGPSAIRDAINTALVLGARLERQKEDYRVL